MQGILQRVKNPGDCGLPEREFHLLENILQLEARQQKVTEQDLIDKLSGNEFWPRSFIDVSKGKKSNREITQDTEHLHVRGYIFGNKDGTITSTRRAALVFKQVYGVTPSETYSLVT